MISSRLQLLMAVAVTFVATASSTNRFVLVDGVIQSRQDVAENNFAPAFSGHQVDHGAASSVRFVSLGWYSSLPYDIDRQLTCVLCSCCVCSAYKLLSRMNSSLTEEQTQNVVPGEAEQALVEIASGLTADVSVESLLRSFGNPKSPTYENTITPFDYLEGIANRFNFPNMSTTCDESSSENGDGVCVQQQQTSAGDLDDTDSTSEHEQFLVSAVNKAVLSLQQSTNADRTEQEEEEKQVRLQIAEKMVEAGLSDASLWLQLGNSWRHSGNYLLATQCYRKCLSMNNNHIDALLNVAVILKNLNYGNDAAVVVAHAVNSNPYGPVQQYIRATILEQRMEPYAALTTCRNILAAHPTFEPCIAKVKELEAQVSIYEITLHKVYSHAGILLWAALGLAVVYAIVQPTRASITRTTRTQKKTTGVKRPKSNRPQKNRH